MTIKVKANEELFKQWQQIGHKITNLASIVQNDMEIEPQELAEWEQLYDDSLSNLKEVHQKTMVQLRADNGPGFHLELLQAELQLVLKEK